MLSSGRGSKEILNNLIICITIQKMTEFDKTGVIEPAKVRCCFDKRREVTVFIFARLRCPIITLRGLRRKAGLQGHRWPLTSLISLKSPRPLPNWQPCWFVLFVRFCFCVHKEQFLESRLQYKICGIAQ